MKLDKFITYFGVIFFLTFAQASFAAEGIEVSYSRRTDSQKIVNVVISIDTRVQLMIETRVVVDRSTSRYPVYNLIVKDMVEAVAIKDGILKARQVKVDLLNESTIEKIELTY